jgi:hypothetical protein
VSRWSVEFVEDPIKVLYLGNPKPRADRVQEILNEIESIPNEKQRTILFVTAKQHLNGDLKELVIAARARANRAWEERERSEQSI